MPSGHSLLYLFGYDVFHQVLFYFGSVAAVVILFWEKFYDKPINWRLAFGAFVFCLFVSTFQAWIDEHANTNNVIQEKASLSSEKSDLAGQLRDKQYEVDYLRDHQLDAFRMGQSSSSQASRVPADTRSSDIASAMKSNSDLIRSLLPRRSEPAENPLKQRLLVLSQDILKMSQDRARIEPRIELGMLQAVRPQWMRSLKRTGVGIRK